MKTLAIVPARAGSKGLPNKNLLPLGGVPLWQVARAQGLAANATDCIVTTDIPDALNADLPRCTVVRRPDTLCQDASPVEDAVLHVLESFTGYDAFVLLNPTCPFRHADDIALALRYVTDWGYPSCTAVRKDFSYTIQEGVTRPCLNRQDTPPRLAVTGSIYAMSVPAFLEFRKLMVFGRITRGASLVVPGPYVDIDSAQEYDIAKFLWERDGWASTIPRTSFSTTVPS